MRRYSLLITVSSLAIAGIVMLIVETDFTTLATPEERFSGGSGDGYVNTICFQSQPAPAVHSLRFSGSLMDGFASTFLVEKVRSMASPSLRFCGGTFDGFAQWVRRSNAGAGVQSGWRFYGGVCDGYAKELRIGTTANGIQSIARFSGGNFDGYVAKTITGSSGVSILSALRFWGGNMDGSASFAFFSLGNLQGLYPMRFSGGCFDGFVTASKSVPMSEIAVDSDHDGIPDWWIIRWYTNLTSIVSTNDTDADGADALAEYISGTDPSKSSSVFKIGSAAQNGNVMELSFPSLDSRVYSLQHINDLIMGSWSNVVGQTRIPGTINGVMTMPVLVTSNSCMLRVIVEFP